MSNAPPVVPAYPPLGQLGTGVLSDGTFHIYRSPPRPRFAVKGVHTHLGDSVVMPLEVRMNVSGGAGLRLLQSGHVQRDAPQQRVLAGQV
eukprot:575830-Prorocentrum_minimum.AAC.6